MILFMSLLQPAAPTVTAAFENLRERAASVVIRAKERVQAIADASLRRLHDTLTSRKADRLTREEKKVQQQRARQERSRE